MTLSAHSWQSLALIEDFSPLEDFLVEGIAHSKPLLDFLGSADQDVHVSQTFIAFILHKNHIIKANEWRMRIITTPVLAAFL